MLVCELMFFAINKFDKHPIESIKTVTAEFYREDEIMAAKQVLIQALPQQVKGAPTEKHVSRRIGLNKVKNSVDDIFNILEVIDSNGLRENIPTFCAANMERIPMMPDEMSDLTSMRYELNELRKQVELLTSKLQPATVPAWKVDVNHGHHDQQVITVDQEFPPLSRQSSTREPQQTSSDAQSSKLAAIAVLQSPAETNREDAGWQPARRKVVTRKRS